MKKLFLSLVSLSAALFLMTASAQNYRVALADNAPQRGDVNGDSSIDIDDVTDLIAYILGDRLEPFSIAAANVDGDPEGLIDVDDVTVLIGYILSTMVLPPEKESFTVNGVTFTMVTVEGGTFTMGATAEQEGDARSNEYPAHQVTLSTYSIGETEVTQALWHAVMGSNPSYFSVANGYSYHMSHPVENVSWDDCQEFINKLNELTGRQFRLPTEAEWEFAARGGNHSQGFKYSGSNDIDEVAWFFDNSFAVGTQNPNYGTHAVVTKNANELGIYDMSGNALEWVQDWYDSYSSDAQTNPTGPDSGTYRVARGGDWGNVASVARVSNRSTYNPTAKSSYRGMRLAL